MSFTLTMASGSGGGDLDEGKWFEQRVSSSYDGREYGFAIFCLHLFYTCKHH
jgi:hypothetical protein